MRGDVDPAAGGEKLAAAFLSCRALLARVVRRIVRPHDVEDILQDAFIRSFEAQERYSIRDPRAFLLRTATNLALNHSARAGYRNHDELASLGLGELVDPGVAPDAQAESDTRFLTFCRAVGSLPEQCRHAFVLRKVYGLTQREIAQEMGLAESTVEKHIARGLLLCRDFMEAAGCRFDLQPAGGSGGGDGRRSA
jgi:RNA polymerase sigma factor (sigma-70 family)